MGLHAKGFFGVDTGTVKSGVKVAGAYEAMAAAGATGAYYGAMVGSVVPGVGTAAGATVGTILAEAYVVYTYWDDVENILGDVWDSVKDVGFLDAVDWVLGPLWDKPKSCKVQKKNIDKKVDLVAFANVLIWMDLHDRKSVPSDTKKLIELSRKICSGSAIKKEKQASEIVVARLNSWEKNPNTVKTIPPAAGSIQAVAKEVATTSCYLDQNIKTLAELTKIIAGRNKSKLDAPKPLPSVCTKNPYKPESSVGYNVKNRMKQTCGDKPTFAPDQLHNVWKEVGKPQGHIHTWESVAKATKAPVVIKKTPPVAKTVAIKKVPPVAKVSTPPVAIKKMPKLVTGGIVLALVGIVAYNVIE